MPCQCLSHSPGSLGRGQPAKLVLRRTRFLRRMSCHTRSTAPPPSWVPADDETPPLLYEPWMMFISYPSFFSAHSRAAIVIRSSVTPRKVNRSYMLMLVSSPPPGAPAGLG